MKLFEKGGRANAYRVQVAVVVIIVLAVCAAVSLTAFNRSYLGENGLYKNGTPLILPWLIVILSIAAALFGALNVSAELDVDTLPKCSGKALTLVSVFFASMCVAIFALFFLLGPLDLQYGVGHGVPFGVEAKMKTAILCYRALIPLSLFAPAYFIVAAVKKRVDALFGSVTLVWALVYILRLYFDVTDWVMSVRKITVICALCAFVFFMINEIRFAFGRGCPRKYFFYSALCAIFCLSSGFAGICCVIIKIYPLNYELAYYGAILALGAFAMIRVIGFLPEKRSYREIYDAYASIDETEGE